MKTLASPIRLDTQCHHYWITWMFRKLWADITFRFKACSLCKSRNSSCSYGFCLAKLANNMFLCDNCLNDILGLWSKSGFKETMSIKEFTDKLISKDNNDQVFCRRDKAQ